MRIIEALLLLTLLATGTSAVVQLVQEFASLDLPELHEALTLDQDERIERGLAHCERILGQPEGKEYWVYSQLRTQTPREAQVFVLCPHHQRALSIGSHLRVLLRPRIIWILDRLPNDWRAKAAAIQAPVYLVDYDSTDRSRLSEACSLISAGEELSIWQYPKGQH